MADHPSIWPFFAKFYDDLTQVLRKNLPPRTTSETVTPPLQTTVPPNPEHSSPSTESTSSRESKAEHHTQAAANDFLWGTHKVIENPLKQIAWYRDGSYRLQTTFYAHWSKS
jgi:hypothetical protein